MTWEVNGVQDTMRRPQTLRKAKTAQRNVMVALGELIVSKLHATEPYQNKEDQPQTNKKGGGGGTHTDTTPTRHKTTHTPKPVRDTEHTNEGIHNALVALPTPRE